MQLRNLFVGLACSVFATAAANAATYNATSYYQGNPSAPEHSLWFSGDSNPAGVAGPKGNHFLFELGMPGFGIFETSGTSASLVGKLANAAGQTYELMLYLVEYNGTAGYKNPFGKDTNTWTLYELDTAQTSMLTYLGDFIGMNDGALQSFNIELRGGTTANPYKVQFGIGANDKDANLLGLSSWLKLTDKNASCASNCTYNGDINVVLAPVPIPATALLLISGLGGLGIAARRKRKVAA